MCERDALLKIATQGAGAEDEGKKSQGRTRTAQYDISPPFSINIHQTGRTFILTIEVSLYAATCIISE